MLYRMIQMLRKHPTEFATILKDDDDAALIDQVTEFVAPLVDHAIDPNADPSGVLLVPRGNP